MKKKQEEKEVVEENKGDERQIVGSYFVSDKQLDFLPSGCQLLDMVLGGGYPLGRVVNIVGDKGTGKSLLAIEACANFHKKYPGGSIWYHEAEAAFDKDYAKALGAPTDAIKFVGEDDDTNDNTVEFLFEQLLYIIMEREKSGDTSPGLYVIDSLDALSDRSEQEREIDKGSYGTSKAAILSQLFRRLIKRIEGTNILLFIVSQVRDNIGVTFGKKYVRAGGKALDFYASQILWLSEVSKFKRMVRGVERSIGLIIKAKCEKNKIGLPYRECQFPILFGFGVDDLTANLEWLSSVKALEELTFPVETSIPKTVEKIRKDQDVDKETKVKTLVKKVWNEIEVNFLPSYAKYKIE